VVSLVRSALGVPCGHLGVFDPRVGEYPTNPCRGFSDRAPWHPGIISEGYFWYHHSPADTIDKVDPEQAQRSAAAMAVWAYAVASLDVLLPR